jgi:hypothetical protein
MVNDFHARAIVIGAPVTSQDRNACPFASFRIRLPPPRGCGGPHACALEIDCVARGELAHVAAKVVKLNQPIALWGWIGQRPPRAVEIRITGIQPIEPTVCARCQKTFQRRVTRQGLCARCFAFTHPASRAWPKRPDDYVDVPHP